MRISESYSSFPTTLRAVAPATAREILRANSESLATDTVSTVGVSAGAERESRIAEIRQRYQNDEYEPDLNAVSASIIDAHLNEPQ